MLDHGPLSDACANGKILPLYILEPGLWKQPDVSYRHFLYLQHYLSQLEDMFIKRGAKLVIKVGEALPVLKSLVTRHNVKAIFSHYETWNKFSKDRDSAIRKWTDENSIDWKEYQQNGVVRNLNSRDGWSTLWQGHMRKKIYEIPKKIFCDVDLTLGDKDFELKQKIYSSGLGGIFPKGIEIGSIYEIQDLTPKEVRIIIDLNADPLTSNYFGVLL